jgi:hypothetical protein
MFIATRLITHTWPRNASGDRRRSAASRRGKSNVGACLPMNVDGKRLGSFDSDAANTTLKPAKRISGSRKRFMISSP